MSDSFDWRILDRHLAGDSTPDDERALRAWLASDPRNGEIVHAARVAAGGSDPRPEPRWDVDRAWSRVSTRMQQPHDDSILPLRRRESSARRTRTRLIASVASALVAAAALIFVVRHPAGLSSGTLATSGTHQALAAAAQQTRVTLGDGSRVVLNAGSRLRYGDFGRGAREVELDGEGYFDVVHDEMRPFRVHARGSIAEDVGTRFLVRAYPEQSAVQVVVTHGSIVLRGERSSAPPTLLVAGQRGRVGADGVITRVNDTDVERWIEWTRGGLLLEGMTFGEAAVDLGRRFGERIEVSDGDLSRRGVSARFHDEPLPRVLDALCAALGARWSRVGGRVVISRNE